ncbi:MAG: hypothetical protein ACLFWG_04120 [Longimicrobiales bacterium]
MLPGEAFHSTGLHVGSGETEWVTVELPFEYETGSFLDLRPDLRGGP